MTIPAFLFGMLISTLIGVGFHLWRNGGLGRFIIYILLSWAGFWIGHIIGAQIGWSFWRVGPIQMGMGILGNLVFLGVGYWLSLIRVERRG